MRNSGCFSLTRHCNTMNIMRSNDGLMKIVYMTCIYIYTRMYIYVYIYIYIDVFMHIMCLNWICYSFDSLQVTVMAVTHHYYRDIGFPLHTFAHHRGAHVRLKQGNLEGTTIILCPRGWHSRTVMVRYSIIGGWSHVEGTSFEMMWRM